MSTELFDARGIADDIHNAAKVPESKNEEIYTMTMQMIGQLAKEMDARGMSMSEQRTRMGRKKDELIKELVSLRERGILKAEDSEPRKERPVRVVKASQVARAS